MELQQVYCLYVPLVGEEKAMELALQYAPPANPSPPAEFVSVREAAAIFAVSQKLIRKLIADGLPISKLNDTIRIKRTDLIRWCQDSATASKLQLPKATLLPLPGDRT